MLQAVAYADACKKAFAEHLKNCQREASAMVHPRRRTTIEEQGILATIKVGDWVTGSDKTWGCTISPGKIGIYEVYLVKGDLIKIKWPSGNFIENDYSPDKLRKVNPNDPKYFKNIEHNQVFLKFFKKKQTAKET